MLQPIAVGQKARADYRHIVGPDVLAEVERLAEPLRGLRTLHLSATAYGGGVSELLYTMVPLMRDVGLDCEWQVIHGQEEFFQATKRLHNALQGADDDLTEGEWAVWQRYNELNAEELSDDWDAIIVHDPQPAAMCAAARHKARHWLWRCHIDLSHPNPTTLARLLESVQHYDATVFHLPSYAPDRVPSQPFIVPPAIDPLAPKNMALTAQEAAFICNQLGIDVDRPLICQVSRFDPWKDPFGVIDAYRIVKEARPDVQLALIGSMAADDPEGWAFYEATVAHAAGDADIHILNNFDHVGNVEVNAFQCQAEVVVQKSTREGFGLTISEALWKGRPLVGGAVGGIPLQVEDGVSGYLVDSVVQCADRILRILDDPAHGQQLGLAGKERVRERFLVPRLLRDWLHVLGTVARDRAAVPEPSATV